jgi:hypothetical protein
MAEISLDFLAGVGVSSRLIEWFGLGHGGYSHVASVLADGRYLDARSNKMGGKWGVGPHIGTTEIVPAGVHIRDPSWEKSVRRMRATIEVTQTQYDDFEENLRAKITDHYASIDIIGFITGREVETKAEYDCSQLALNGMQHIKVFPYPLWVEGHQVSPDVLLFMMNAIKATLTPMPAFV